MLLAAQLPRHQRAIVRKAGTRVTQPATAGVLQTFNVFGLPWPIGEQVTLRCDLVARALARTGPEVVALQEVWDEQARTPLLQLDGYHASWCDSPEGLFGQNGLMTLSRHPVLTATCRCFAAASGVEAFIGKGALRTIVARDDGSQLDVWNVHLQSGAEAGEVRRRQITELVDWVRGSVVPDRVVLGDFNCGPGDAEWDLLVRGLAALDLVPCACDLNTYDNTQNPLAADEPPSTLDHVFVTAAGAGALRARRIHDQPEQGTFLSDHFGLEVRLRPTPAPGALATERRGRPPAPP